MLYHSRARALAVALAVSISPSALSNPPEEEVIIAHEVRIAFYEIAPASIAESMRVAVTLACANLPTDGWLCSGRPLVFLRAVYVTGDKKLAGVVCPGNDSEAIEFYAPDMIEGGCVTASYNGEANQHSIDPRDLAADKDAE